MTKILILLVAVLGLFLTLSPAATATQPAAGPGADHVAGVIEKILPAKHGFVLTRPNGNKVFVQLKPKTKIRVDGQPATFADLAVGQKARAIGKFGPKHHKFVAARVRAKN
jgi:hypothetical protein